VRDRAILDPVKPGVAGRCREVAMIAARARSRVWKVALAAVVALGPPPAAPASVFTEAQQALLRQLSACVRLENALYVGAQNPSADVLDFRKSLATNIECVREISADLGAATAAAIGISDQHYLQAHDALATALRLEEKDLARLDAKLAKGTAVVGIPRNLEKAMIRKAAASLAIKDLNVGAKPLPEPAQDFTIPSDVVADPQPVQLVTPLPGTNVLPWRPELVGKRPDRSSGWTVTRRDGKIALKKFELPDGIKRRVFQFQGTGKNTTGTASYTTDDVLQPPFFVQGTGGIYAPTAKRLGKAVGARLCLTLDREPQTVPPQFYGICTNHVLTPSLGTQVFDFTDAGLAGGNVFFPGASLVALRIAFDGAAIHAEAQPRGDPGARLVVQGSLVLPIPWTGARAGFGGAQLAKGAALGIEHVVAWNDPTPFFVTLGPTTVRAQPNDAAAVLDAIGPFGPFEPIQISSDDQFLQTLGNGIVGWVPRTGVVPFNTQTLPVGN
jgi:hypothetical protein